MDDEISHSRRSTRAQAAPGWTSAETLTLLDEIAAVDRDCGDTVASFQKWKTVSKNISANGLRRSLDQCRRKWASLMEAYGKVKELGSFWNLDEDVRAEAGVSEDFDLEVFRAMDEYLEGKDEKDGERESGGEGTDREAGEEIDGADRLIEDYEEESGFGKQKNHLVARKKRNTPETLSKPLKETAKKKPKPQIKPTILTEEVDEEVNLLNEQKMLLATNLQSFEEVQEEEEEVEQEQDDGQVLAENLLEYAKSIEAIVKQTPSVSDDPLSADSKDAETDFIRDQGDQLVAYLGKLAQTLEQLCDCPIMFPDSV